MIAVLQRALNSEVVIDGTSVGKGGHGFLLLVGFERGDDSEDLRLMAEKILKIRLFSDDAGKMNLSVCDIEGDILVVPNFTLLAAYRKGNRPDFMNSAPPAEAREMFEKFKSLLAEHVHTESGVFGADMKVSLCNDGPVTVVMDSRVLKRER